MTTPTPAKNTNAFFAQAAIAFGIALIGMIVGEVYLPLDPWMRAFLAVGTIFLVTSSFTLAKCVRDAQENLTVVSRLDQARLERLLAEFDPYELPHLAKAAANADRPPQGPQGPQAPPGYNQNLLSI
jgi:hypothetical protein